MSTPTDPVPAMPAPPAPPGTPVKVASAKPATPGSRTNRMQCSDDPKDFNMVKIHTAKCSVCDKRNASDEMRRCKGCTWQICRPCQIKREQQGRTLAHGNLVTATPGSSLGRGTKMVPVKPLTPKKDAKAGTPLETVKEEHLKEDRMESAAKESPATKKSTPQGNAMTPPSSGERKNLGRKSKVHTNYAEPEDESEEERSPLRKARTPVGSAGGGKRKIAGSSSPANEQSPTPKRARTIDTQALPPLRPSPKIWGLQKNLDMSDSDESKHSKIMQSMFGHSPKGRAILEPNLYNYTPAPESNYTRVPALPQPFPAAQNGVPRMSGEEFMEKIVRPKVRKNLAERYAWPYETPAVTCNPPTDSATPTSPNDTLRDLADNEARALHHNLTLDEDQQAELLSAMRHAARIFGNTLFSKMAPGFKAMAKPGLDLALVYVNESERLAAVAAVQKQAASKLREFEEEIGRLAGHR